MTVSRLWDELRGRRSIHALNAPIDYQWFILSLDLLYMIGALEFGRGLVRRTTTTKRAPFINIKFHGSGEGGNYWVVLPVGVPGKWERLRT
jgi:hypothetical protein